MSGGSFDYLCFGDLTELFGKRQQIEDMAKWLAENGHTDAAQETETVLLILQHFEVRMQARLSRLQPVWKAAEWHTSGDSGAEAVASALAKYRSEVDVAAPAPAE